MGCASGKDACESDHDDEGAVVVLKAKGPIKGMKFDNCDVLVEVEAGSPAYDLGLSRFIGERRLRKSEAQQGRGKKPRDRHSVVLTCGEAPVQTRPKEIVSILADRQRRAEPKMPVSVGQPRHSVTLVTTPVTLAAPSPAVVPPFRHTVAPSSLVQLIRKPQCSVGQQADAKRCQEGGQDGQDMSPNACALFTETRSMSRVSVGSVRVSISENSSHDDPGTAAWVEDVRALHQSLRLAKQEAEQLRQMYTQRDNGHTGKGVAAA
eukprot:TRINITY_DN227_c10_g1_i1.p1 TRINITY_DN227_c10_g1~~TRINITY_DN227_c10_g1_i1.p1  ORF type:complete len:272 (+),score=83.96 TRINITY_DN227_c10_g1_i1:26-817(+)